MKVAWQNASRARLAWLFLHACGIAFLAGCAIPSYFAEWAHVSTLGGRIRTIAGGSAWGLACVTMVAVAILCLVRLPRRPPPGDSVRKLYYAIPIELILVVLAGMVLDGGILLSFVITVSIIINFAILITPRSANKKVEDIP